MYYVVYGFFYLMSLLPLRVLFLLSDFAYFIIYHVAGYRKNIVMQNITIAFPEKSEEEKLKIARQFYKNLTDTFIETIKLFSVSNKWLDRHFTGDLSVLVNLYNEGRKCQVHLGHNFNWEMANMAIPRNLSYITLAVYMPLNNKTLDRVFRKLRSRNGSVLLPATQMSKSIIPYRNSLYMLGLVADQNPGVPGRAYWLNFFGRPTPFVKGPEKGARVNDTAVVFCHITKRKRGYYEIHAELATKTPLSLPETELTRMYIHYLEKVIRANPEMWLWSHRRWKYEWKVEYGPIVG
jgi:KDO2-lipid IV(A) lauroyltransferase